MTTYPLKLKGVIVEGGNISIKKPQSILTCPDSKELLAH